MFIFSTKVTKGKLLTLSLICACLAIIIIVSIPTGDIDTAKTASLKAKTNEERVSYLQSFGWTVDETPIEQAEVIIPAEFDETYEEYNLLQQLQGFNLANYKGKQAVRYTYTITNYPSAQTSNVQASLLVYKDKIIGGDVASTSLGGFMHTLQMPDEKSSATTILDDSSYDSVNETAGLTAEEILAAISAVAEK